MANRRNRRISKQMLSLVLVFVMAFACVPTPAVAEVMQDDQPSDAVEQLSKNEPQSDLGSRPQLISQHEGEPSSGPEVVEAVATASQESGTTVENGLVEESLGNANLADNDDLAAAYIEEQFNALIPTASVKRSNSAASSAGLSVEEARLYAKLKERITEVAEGTLTNTQFAIPVGSVFTQLSYTAEELGVSSSDRDAAVAKAQERFTLGYGKVLYCLLADCPYELYWFDKTVGCSHSTYPAMNLTSSNGVLTITATGSILVNMCVAKEYSATQSAGTYDTNGTLGQSIQAAVTNASNVVTTNAGKTVRARLAAYKDAICSYVSYNSAAAKDESTPYGNPWQLVWVFDGNNQTNVVCEGYSKAFKYLCDLTWADQEVVECSLATGSMAGGTGEGPHMWNVVRMDDGKNYLVDVTNCDEGSVGAPDKLFLAYGPTGEWSGTYVFAAGNEGVAYAYDEDTKGLYGESGLTISNSEYVAPTPLVEVDVPAATDGLEYNGNEQTGVQVAAEYVLTGNTATNAGDYTATATLKDGYVWSDGTRSAKQIAWSIARRQATVTADNKSKNEGEADPELTATVSGTVGTDTISYVLTRAEGEDLGEYAITPSGDAAQGNYDVAYVPGTLTIHKTTLYSGTWGGCTWEVFVGGLLLIRPTDGVSGELPETYSKTPWADYAIKQKIKSVRVEQGVVARNLGKFLYGCDKLVDVDLSGLDTSGVANMSEMFDECSGLTTLDLSSFDTSQVTNMSSMFKSCPRLETLDISSFDTSRVTNMENMFKYCPRLQTISLGSGFSFCGSGDTRVCSLCEYYDASYSTAYAPIWYSTSDGAQYAYNELPNNVLATYKRSVQIDDPNNGICVVYGRTSFTYDGTEHEPEVVSVTHGSTVLTEGVDYEVVASGDWVNVNSAAAVLVVGKAGYAGTISKSVTINGISVQGAVIELDPTECVYDGTAKEPAVLSVTLDGQTLVADRDYTVSYATNTNAGEGQVTVTGAGNYGSSATKTFTIQPATVQIPAAPSDLVYSGAAQTGVEAGQRYTLSGTYSATNAGSYQAHASLKDTANYRWSDNTTGQKAIAWSIAPKALDNNDVVFSSIEDQLYDGTALRPSVTITYGTETLNAGTDYNLAYANNNKAGTATITATFTGNYSGTASTTFTIKPLPTSSLTIEDIVDQTYTGSAITPVPSVKFGQQGLTPGTDFTYTYENNVNAGTATVVITGAGSYEGTVRKTFAINPAPFTQAKTNLKNIVLSSDYDGNSKAPLLDTIVYNLTSTDSITLIKDVDYTVDVAGDAINAGQFSVTIAAAGGSNIEGSFTLAFTIRQASLQTGAVALETYEPVYTGSPLEPVVTATVAGRTLVKDVDYTVTYGGINNVVVRNALGDGYQTGKAWAKIDGIGNYSGSCTRNYTVVPRDISGATITLTQTEYTYGDTQNFPSASSVTLNGRELAANTDYKVQGSYRNAGTHQFTIEGRGNYTGTASTPVTVNPKDLSSAEVKVNPQDQVQNCTYNGSPKTPAMMVVLDSHQLTFDTDYTVTYANNVHAGSATATIVGKGNYTGEAIGSFTVFGKSVGDCEASVSTEGLVYDGTEKTPAVTLTDGDKVLVEGTDYSVEYPNNVVPGNKQAIVTGMGDYAGTTILAYSILQVPFGDVTIDPVEDYNVDRLSFNSEIQLHPTIVVKYKGEELREGVDWEAEYPSVREVFPGTYLVPLRGKGVFSSDYKSASFTVVGPMDWTYVEPIAGQAYTGNELRPKLHIHKSLNRDKVIQNPSIPEEYLSEELVEGVDYTLSYANNVELGEGRVTITGKGCWSGSVSKTFKINPYPLGWFKRGNAWYYADYDVAGNMFLYKGFGYIRNHIYYFDESTGALKSGWQSVYGTWYYLNPSNDCRAATGWSKINGSWYYFNTDSGAMQTGWQKVNGSWYLLAPGGAMLSGWQKDGGKWYYLDPANDSRMATGWRKVGGWWYLFALGGQMLSGWQRSGSSWYYLNPANDSRMATGWLKVNGYWYLFAGGGQMLSGWQKDGGKWYYLNSANDSRMATGWLKIGNTWYYFNGSGIMVTGRQNIGGKWYTFNSNGAWVA